jgi:hypothetical protein
LHLRDEGAFVLFQKKEENELIQRILSVEDWGRKMQLLTISSVEDLIKGIMIGVILAFVVIFKFKKIFIFTLFIRKIKRIFK